MNTFIRNFPKPSLVSKFKEPQSKDKRQANRIDFLPFILCRLIFKFIYGHSYDFFWEVKWEGSGRYSNVVWGPCVDCGSGKNKHITCVGRKRCLKRAMIHSGSWIYCWSSSLLNICFGEKKKKCNKRYCKHKNQWQKQPLQTQAKSMGKEGAWIFPTRDHRL